MSEEWRCECCDYATVRVDDLIRHLGEHGYPPAAVKSAARYSRIARVTSITVRYRIDGRPVFRWIGEEEVSAARHLYAP